MFDHGYDGFDADKDESLFGKWERLNYEAKVAVRRHGADSTEAIEANNAANRSFRAFVNAAESPDRDANTRQTTGRWTQP